MFSLKQKKKLFTIYPYGRFVFEIPNAAFVLKILDTNEFNTPNASNIIR